MSRLPYFALALFCIPCVIGVASPAEESPLVSGAASLFERRLLAVIERQETLFNEAAAGDIEEAEFTRRAAAIASEYDGIIAANRQQVLPYIFFGKFLRRINEPEEAHKLFAIANQLDPKIAVVKQQLGNYYAESGLHAPALGFYMAAVELEPHQAPYHFGLGEVLRQFKDEFVADGAMTEEAVAAQMLSAFAEARRLDPDSKDFAFRYAEAFYDLPAPNWEGALQAWEEAAKRNLSETEAEVVGLHRARVLIELGRGDEAREILLKPVRASLEQTRQDLLAKL